MFDNIVTEIFIIYLIIWFIMSLCIDTGWKTVCRALEWLIPFDEGIAEVEEGLNLIQNSIKTLSRIM